MSDPQEAAPGRAGLQIHRHSQFLPAQLRRSPLNSLSGSHGPVLPTCQPNKDMPQTVAARVGGGERDSGPGFTLTQLVGEIFSIYSTTSIIQMGF